MSRQRDRPKCLAEKLRAIRQHLGLSQTEMKQRMEFAGHYGRISEYERGKRQPSISTLLAYARAAFVPLEYLVDDEVALSRFRNALLEARPVEERL
jgi:transcriptional regulator with XRE-family HTH domain